MSSIGHRVVLITFLAGTMFAVGCQSAQPAPVAGIKPPPSPENVKEARFHQAIEGLDFETGFVQASDIPFVIGRVGEAHTARAFLGIEVRLVPY